MKKTYTAVEMKKLEKSEHAKAARIEAKAEGIFLQRFGRKPNKTYTDLIEFAGIIDELAA